MRVNNLVDSRHHGENGRVRDDGRRDLGLGQGKDEGVKGTVSLETLYSF